MEEWNIKAVEGKWCLAEERGKEEAQRFKKELRVLLLIKKLTADLS